MDVCDKDSGVAGQKSNSERLLPHESHRNCDIPGVVKRYDFPLTPLTAAQTQMTSCLNATLLQAKLHHPNVCEVLELGLEIDQSTCSVYYQGEVWESDLAHDIEDRVLRSQPFTEKELTDMAIQVATALAYAHSKGYAHGDVKPATILRTGCDYKLSGFGCFCRQEKVKGKIRGSDDCKGDVFALGTSLLHAVTGTSPELLLPASQLPLQGLTSEMQHLISSMLASDESQRPTMQEVCNLLSSLSPASPPPQLVHVGAQALRYFNLPTHSWEPPINLQQEIQVDVIGSRWVVLDDSSVFCCGGGWRTLKSA